MSSESSQNLQPVIIIGAARSGTKFLRDLIGASTACCVVPYDVNYIWRYRNEGLRHDALPPESCTDRTAEYIRRCLKAAARYDGSALDRPTFLVEKTVSNCLRVPFIDRVFPDAVYINLVRDGRNVVESSVRMWQEPVSIGHVLEKVRYFPLRNFSYAAWYLKNVVGGWVARNKGVRVWGVRYSGIELDIRRLSVPEICAKQWRICVEQSANDLASISSSRVLSVRYESLTGQEDEVKRICEFLKLPDQDHVLEHYHRENRPGAKNGWYAASNAPGWDAAMEVLAPALESLGYH